MHSCPWCGVIFPVWSHQNAQSAHITEGRQRRQGNYKHLKEWIRKKEEVYEYQPPPGDPDKAEEEKEWQWDQQAHKALITQYWERR